MRLEIDYSLLGSLSRFEALTLTQSPTTDNIVVCFAPAKAVRQELVLGTVTGGHFRAQYFGNRWRTGSIAGDHSVRRSHWVSQDTNAKRMWSVYVGGRHIFGSRKRCPTPSKRLCPQLLTLRHIVSQTSTKN